VDENPFPEKIDRSIEVQHAIVICRGIAAVVRFMLVGTAGRAGIRPEKHPTASR
jgi:hypothetical protein